MSATPVTRTEGEPQLEAAVNAAVASSERPPRPSALANCLTFGWRGMLKIKHVPEQLLDVTVTPVLFLLMFTYLFGGAVAGSTGEYLQFILPGVLVQSVLFTAVYSGVALNTDITKGVVDRFRSLPVWRPAPLVGAVVGDSARYVLAATVVIVLGFIMGFEAAGGVPGVVAAVAVIVAFTFGLSWVFTTIGLVMRAPNAVLNTGFMVLFPLVFLSNIFVEPSTLPSWLESFVDVNPISHLVTAVRGLMAGSAATEDVLLVLGEAAVLTAIFAPLTVRLYRRAKLIQDDDARARDPVDARVLVLGLREPRDRVRVAVEDVPRLVVVDPRPQPLEAEVRGVVGVVVDAARRAVAEQHVGGGQALGQLRRLALRVVVVAAAAVLDAALETRERARAERGAPEVEVVDLDLAQQVRLVVVAVHAVLRELQPRRPSIHARSRSPRQRTAWTRIWRAISAGSIGGGLSARARTRTPVILAG